MANFTIGRMNVILSATTARFSKKMRGATSSVARFATGVKSAALSMSGLFGAAAVGFAASRILKTFISFEAGMSRVKALTGATAKEFDSLNATAKRLGQTTQFTATQSAEAMQFFALAGFETSEIIKSMVPTLNLAAVGQLEIAEAADIAAKLMAGMGLSADQLGSTVDTLAKAMTTANTNLVQLGEAMAAAGPIGKSLGKDVSELVASIQAMSDAGIQGEKAGTALRNIMIRMADAGGEAGKELTRLGVAVADEQGRFRNLADIIGDLATATSSMTDVQKSSTLVTIGGLRAVAALNVMIAKGGDGLREMEDALNDAGGTAKRIADIQLDNLRGSLIEMKSAAEGVAISLGDMVDGPVRAMVDGMTNMLRAMTDVSDQWDVFKASAEVGILQAGVAVSGFLDTIINVGINIGKVFKKAFENIGIMFRNLFGKGVMLGILDNFVEFVKRTFGNVLTITKNLATNMGELFKAAFEAIKTGSLEPFKNLALKNLTEGTKNVLDPILDVVAAITKGTDVKNIDFRGINQDSPVTAALKVALEQAQKDLERLILKGSQPGELPDAGGKTAAGAAGGTGTDGQQPFPGRAGALVRGSTAEFSARLAALGRGGDKDKTAKETEKNTAETVVRIDALSDVIREFGLTTPQAAVVSIR